MASIELQFNPSKKLLRKDVVKMGKTIAEQAKKKIIDSLVIKITDDNGANAVSIPFLIVDKK